MQTKEYILPNGKKAVFEYDITGVGKITLECMDELMSMIADRPQGEWIRIERNENIEGHIVPMRIYKCSTCGEKEVASTRFCPNCGAMMKGADNE